MQYGLSDQYADELPFIREILFDVDDPTPRMIYSDWLEERGDIRGEFMRLDQQLYELGLQDPGATEIRKRRTKLILQIDQRWTTLLAQAPIEECDLQKEFAFLCPKRWRNLKPSGDDKDVRYCDQCGKSVTYCYTIGEAKARANANQCVAIDPSVLRRPNDLQGDYTRELLGLLIDPGELRTR